jgi:branched-chain amino acid transport system substrate-binding protein
MRRREVIAGVAAASMMGVSPFAAAAESVRVGAIEALTGPNAGYGIAIRAGLELALDEVNQAGGVLGGRPIALIVEDSAGDKDQALRAAQKLIERDKVVALLGPTLSIEMFAVGPFANEHHVPTLGTSTTASGVTAIGPYIFRTALPESDVIPVTIAWAKAHGIRRLALIYARDDTFSQSGFEVMRSAAEASGVAVVASESFASKDTDLSVQLTRIGAQKPDAVGVSALVEPLAAVLVQARQLGLGAQTLFIGGNGANSPKLVPIAGVAAEGLIVGSPWFIGDVDPINLRFVAAYRRRTSMDPDQFAAQAYDGMRILAAAIERAGVIDGDRIREALTAADIAGVTGPFRFTAAREPASTEGVVVLTVRGGRFVLAG